MRNANVTGVQTSTLKVCTASASFTFAGDANHDGSSDAKTFEITKAPSTTTVTCTPTETYTDSTRVTSTQAGTADALFRSPKPVYANNTDPRTPPAHLTFPRDPNHHGSSD